MGVKGGKMRFVEKHFEFGGSHTDYFRFGDDNELKLTFKTRDHNYFIIWIRKMKLLTTSI